MPAPRARIGRSQAPQPAPVRGIEGTHAPLRAATPTSVPGAKARVVLSGLAGAKLAIELVEIDAGRVAWRDTTACAGPVVGASEHAVVCADANGVYGLALATGKLAWKLEANYLAMTEDRVVIEGAGEAVVVDAASGDELTRVKLPETVMADSLLASCGDAGRELFAQGQDSRLVRISDIKGKVAVAWSIPTGKIEALDACAGDTVLVREPNALIAIDRASGKVTGRVDGVRGYWQARDGSAQLEVSTASGVRAWPRDLAGEGVAVFPFALGELIDARGGLRLVRATSGTAVVLDREGVRAYLGFAAMSGALGDTGLVLASWQHDDLPRRLGFPERYRKALRLPGVRAGVAPPAELRDLPPATEIAPQLTMDRGAAGVLDLALADSVAYVLTTESANLETETAGIVAADLAAKSWRWQTACEVGEAVKLAVARDMIACATRTRSEPGAKVRALGKDGKPRWLWQTERIRDLAAAGDAVLVFDADVVTVLDAGTGSPRWRLTSGDGGPAIATAITAGSATVIVASERGHVVARTLSGWPLWAIAVDGNVRAIQPAGAGVLVELEDGDAYRIELGGVVHALPGLNLAWQGAGDVVVAHTAGGPVPGQPVPPPLRVLKPVLERKKPPPPAEDVDPERPRLWTPIPPPPALGESLQVTLFEPTGGLRVRNDYGLLGAGVATRRGPEGSPVVISAGREVLSIDPRTGDPLRRIQLPEDAGLVFGTIVDGTPVAGAVLAAPLRVVLF